MLDTLGVFLYTGGIMMTKQNYIAIAKILNKYSWKDSDHMILLKLCQYFKEDNPNFDADIFLDVVSGTDDKLK